MPAKKIVDTGIYLLAFLNLFFLSAILSFQVTLQGETVTVPDLLGKTLDEARADLEKRKVHITQVGVRLHDRWERGRIIFQDPPPETRVKLNAEIQVLLSAGKEKAAVPDLLGKNLQDILGILEEAGLRKGKVSHVHSPRFAAGKIIAQYPPPGVEAGRGSEVSVLVSQGAHDLMPDLIGKKVSPVLSQLKALGFNVGNIRYRYYHGLDSGTIINQTPPPGSKIQKRNRIALEVSK